MHPVTARFAAEFETALLDEDGQRRPFGEAIRIALELSPTKTDGDVLAEVVAWRLELERLNASSG